MDLSIFPQLIPIADKMAWDAKEVVRDVDNVPHLFHRVTLTGPTFPQRALEPVVTVGGVKADRVEISEDGSFAKAYFSQSLPGKGVIEFGFEDGVLYRYPKEFERQKLLQLDRQKLPKNIRLIDITG